MPFDIPKFFGGKVTPISKEKKFKILFKLIASLAAPAVPLFHTQGIKTVLVIFDCLLLELLHSTLKTSFISH